MNIFEMKISPCRGCFGCWQVKNKHCVIDNDQNRILDLYPEVDLIIWSFPLYCFGMPSHIKAVLDRTIPLNQMKMEIVDGRTRHLLKKSTFVQSKNTLNLSSCTSNC